MLPLSIDQCTNSEIDPDRFLVNFTGTCPIFYPGHISVSLHKGTHSLVKRTHTRRNTEVTEHVSRLVGG